MARASRKTQQEEESKVRYFKPTDLKISLTSNQKPISNLIVQNQITILTGDPGTGKTTIALYYAIRQLLNGQFEKIYISKNPVESGASVGFLPGELEDKLAPYKESYIDVIVNIVGKLKATDLLKTNKIVFTPIGFIRGKTFENACIILDEAQNMELKPLMSFVTRIHETSKMIILGDEYQTDIKSSGLMDLVQITSDVRGVGYVDLGDEFQMRSKIITDIYNNYKNFLNKKKKAV